jgi:hypothetical protein
MTSNPSADSSNNAIVTVPPFDVPENEKTPDWYIRNIRYRTQNYNRSYHRVEEDTTRVNLTPIENAYQMMLYYLGKQRNIDYNHLTQDPSGQTLQATWIKGKKVKAIIDYLLGLLSTQFSNKEVSALNLSKSAASAKMDKYNDIMLKYDVTLDDLWKEMQQMGVHYNPQAGQQFKDEDDIKQWQEYGTKDESELLTIDIAKHIEESNDSNTMYLRQFLEFCAANYCATYNYVENGQIKQKKIAYHDLIWDVVDDDTLNRKMRSAGFLERLTPQEIFLRYPKLTDVERDEIKQMVDSKDSFDAAVSAFNQPNLNWYYNYGGEKVITCVTMFWKGQRDLRYKKMPGKFESEFIKKLSVDKTTPGDYITMDVHKGTLIGNRWLQDYGYAENTVRNTYNKSDVELPIIVLSGNIVFGDGVSPIGIVHQSQDRIDAFRSKIMEYVSRDAGRTVWINGALMGEGVSAKEIVSDLKSMGVTVLQGTTGESNDPQNNNKLLEMHDLSLSPEVMKYIDLIREEERIMESALSVSEISMGQQVATVGKAVQQGTIAQNQLGITKLFRDFFAYNEMVLQHALNVAKMVYTLDGDNEAVFVVGDRGVKFLKITKQYRFEDFLVYVKTKNTISEQKKAELTQIAQAMAQNQQIDILDYINIISTDTLVELYKKLEYSIKKKKEEQAAAQQQQQQFEAQQQQAKQQALTGAALHGQMVQKDIADKKNETKILSDLLKDSKVPHPMQQQPQS